MKYYAVKVGSKPGIYTSWAECEPLVKGYPNAMYKSFKTLPEAQNYMTGGKQTCENQTDSLAKDSGLKDNGLPYSEYISGETVLPSSYAFTDGSYNQVTKVYGYGGYFVQNENKHILQGSDIDAAGHRNVSGEIEGAMAATRKAVELGVKEFTLFFDYMGICMWATGNWKTNNEATTQYKEFMQDVMHNEGIKINFVHSKGHAGIPGNEEADMLAKQACNIE